MPVVLAVTDHIPGKNIILTNLVAALLTAAALVVAARTRRFDAHPLCICSLDFAATFLSFSEHLYPVSLTGLFVPL